MFSLSRDIFNEILQYLDIIDRVRWSQVNKQTHDIIVKSAGYREVCEFVKPIVETFKVCEKTSYRLNIKDYWFISDQKILTLFQCWIKYPALSLNISPGKYIKESDTYATICYIRDGYADVGGSMGESRAPWDVGVDPSPKAMYRAETIYQLIWDKPNMGYRMQTTTGYNFHLDSIISIGEAINEILNILKRQL